MARPDVKREPELSYLDKLNVVRDANVVLFVSGLESDGRFSGSAADFRDTMIPQSPIMT